MRESGAPCSVMNDVKQMLESEQVAAVNIVQPLPIAEGDDHRVVGVPFSINGMRSDGHRAPPRLGEHTQSVLAAAGLRDSEIESLAAKRVIA